MAEEKFSNAFSLTDEIANILRERVLRGEYAIGEKIKESQLTEELKVSRTPIREAFKQLEAEGLMEYIPNRGCFAKGFTKQDMQDIYAVRQALEQLAVEWAVDRISDKEMVRLQEEYELMEFYTRRRDSKKVYEINKTFHEIIYGSTRSRFMAQILRSYQDYVRQTRKATVYEENLDTILMEHREILEAIKSKDGALAVEKIGVHLENSKKRAEARWGL